MTTAPVFTTILSVTIFIFLLCTYTIAEEKRDKINPKDRWATAINSIDNGDRYGRIRVADTRQNDEEYKYFTDSGIMCTTIDFQPYSLFHEHDDTYFTMDAFNSVTHDHMGFMVTANHLGKQVEVDKLTAMTAFSIHHGNNHNQFCVRDFAHFGEKVRDYMFGPMNKHFDQQDSQFDWINLPRGKFGSKVYMGNKQSYGCVPFEIGSEYTDEDYSFFVSLDHLEFVTTHYGVNAFHYDAVWVERQDERTVSACWADIDEWDGTHSEVYIQMIIIPKTSGPKAPTTGPKPNVDYEVDTYTFEWSSDNDVKVTCVDIPFKKEYSFIPYMFATVELPHMPSSNDTSFHNQATTTWVENASPNSMQVCVSEQFWADQTKKAKEQVKVHYMVVENTIAEDETPKQTGEMQVVFKNFDPTKIFKENSTDYTDAFYEDAHAWVNKAMGKDFGDQMKMYIVPEHFETEDETNFPQVYFYFTLFDQEDPETYMKAFNKYMDDHITIEKVNERKDRRGNDIWDEIYIFTPNAQDNTAFFSNYGPVEERFEIPSKAYGGTCAYGRNTVGECSAYKCDFYGGTQTLSREVVKEEFGNAPTCQNNMNMTSFCKSEFSATEFKTYEVKPLNDSTWEMEYFMERYDTTKEDPIPDTNPDPIPDTNPDPKTEEEEASNGGGVSTVVFVIVVVAFVIVMIGEYFVVSSYFQKKTRKAFYVGSSEMQPRYV